MTRRPKITRAYILLLAMALSGCVSFGPKPAKMLLTLTPATTVVVGSERTASPGSTISVLNPGAPAAVATTRIPVYDGASQLSYVKDAAWNDAPSRLFGGLLAETIAARTGKIVISLRQYAATPDMQLSGQLQKFGIDPASMQAVVVYDGILARSGGKIETRRFEARAPVSAIEAGEVGSALNRAANDAAAQIAEWVKS